MKHKKHGEKKIKKFYNKKEKFMKLKKKKKNY